VSREAAAAEMIAVAASRLEFLRSFFCGLTLAAIGCRRFATLNSATSKRVSEGSSEFSPSLTRRITSKPGKSGTCFGLAPEQPCGLD